MKWLVDDEGEDTGELLWKIPQEDLEIDWKKYSSGDYSMDPRHGCSKRSVVGNPSDI